MPPEPQQEDDVLPVGDVHVAAELVGGSPKNLLEAEVGAASCGFLRVLLGASHA